MDIKAKRFLDKSLLQRARALQELSSGQRNIGAAEQSIASQLDASASQRAVSIRNANDALSFTQVADQQLSSSTGIIDRIRELTTQAQNGTLNDDQRGLLQAEVSQLSQELTRQGQSSTFNGRNVTESLDVQVGDSLTIEGTDFDAISSAVSSIDISTIEGARDAVSVLDSAASQISSQRATIGAGQARLGTAIENEAAQLVAERTAESSIRDTDFADATLQNTLEEIKTRGAAFSIQAAAGGGKNGLTVDTVRKLLGN